MGPGAVAAYAREEMRAGRTRRAWRVGGLIGTALALGGGLLRPVNAGPSQAAVSLVRVSGVASGTDHCPTDGANTPRVAVDPANPSSETVSWEVHDGAAAVLGTSGDGGRSWHRVLLAGVTTCSGGPIGHIVDPYLAEGSGGRIVATSSWVGSGSAPAVGHGAIRVFVTAMSAGGRPGPPLDLERSQPDQRAPVLVERADPSHVLVAVERVPVIHPGTYLPAAGSIAILRSTDGGRTFPGPKLIDAPLPGTDPLTSGRVQAGSTLVAVVAHVDDTQALPTLLDHAPVVMHLLAFRSVDDGRTFTGPVSIGTFPAAVQGGPYAGGCCIADVVGSPGGRAAVVWPDESGHIHLAVSANEGLSWASSVVATASHQALDPAAAILGDGRVAVAYYDRSADGPIRPYLTVSPARGRPALTIPLAASFPVTGITDGNSDTGPIGPFQGIVAIPGGVRVALTLGGPYGDHSDDEEIWQATVSGPGFT